MKYHKFTITNFKGIENAEISLVKSPEQKVFTFVGLNESGKTTVLEAINFFHYGSEQIEPVKPVDYASSNYHGLIPISKRDNFNSSVSITIEASLDTSDLQKIYNYATTSLGYKSFSTDLTFIIKQKYNYVNSSHTKHTFEWTTNFRGRLPKERKERPILPKSESDKENWQKLVSFVGKMLPRIIYFPNFLFNFPDQVYLDPPPSDIEKHKFYCAVVQDVLDSLGTGANIETHILSRAKSGKQDDKKNLLRQLQLISRSLTDAIFGAWSEIFQRKLDKEIIVNHGLDEDNRVYLEFNIKDADGEYLVSDRSLGFRWFFVFFLLTHFRRFRKDNSLGNLVFLFDEPASNLHPSAQSQLLKSLDKLSENSIVMYTTHSHHLINPAWLEGAFVVKNSGIHYDSEIEKYHSRKTHIEVCSYRKFASDYPDQTSYFQPILDVLQYAPSKLEFIPDVIMVEGKHDYYALSYAALLLNKKINLLPCTGAESLNDFISLYMAWGRNFIVMLDSDSKGLSTKKAYLEKFGLAVEGKIFTLNDADASVPCG